MTNLPNETSKNLVKYINLLSKSSESFKERREAFTQSTEGRDFLEDELESIMNDYFIPITEENKTYVYWHLLTGNVTDKFSFHGCLNASEENPVDVRIEEPTMLIKINGDIKSQEWEARRIYLLLPKFYNIS